jgi:hypothetical protein
MSGCPSFSLSCDNNHWNCCGSAKEPDQHGDGSLPKQQQPSAHHPPPTQPPTSVVAPPPSESVPLHHVSSPVAPFNDKVHEPPVTAATPIPAAVPPKRYEPLQPARTAVIPFRVPSKTYDDGGVQAVTTMRPPLPHRISEAPAPAVAPLQPATATPPGVRSSQYPLARHPQHQDTCFRGESYSQAY